MREKLKLKRINTSIVLVADDILHREIQDGASGEKVYVEINSLVKKINSGLLGFEKERECRERLLTIMLDENIDEAEVEKQEESTATILRKMKKVSTVHDKFEYGEDGLTYLKGFSVPIPLDLANALLDAHYNPFSKYTVESLIHFWEWALLNKNKDARNDLFKWFKTGSFAITDDGMVVAYRCVEMKQKGTSNELRNFIESRFIIVKGWKKSPRNYAVVDENGVYEIISLKTHPDVQNEKNFLGILSDMYADLDSDSTGDVFTDAHTRKMEIKIGEEVRISRDKCDENREAQCSRGLHFMSKAYNLRLGSEKLIVLINPMDIVAFPSYDQSKGRSCAYLPVARALLDENGDIEEFDAGTYDFSYAEYGRERLEKLLSEHTFEELQTMGEIADDITLEDFESVRDNIKSILSQNVVKCGVQ